MEVQFNKIALNLIFIQINCFISASPCVSSDGGSEEAMARQRLKNGGFVFTKVCTWLKETLVLKSYV